MKTTKAVKLTKNRLDKYTQRDNHAVIKMVNGKAQIIDNTSFGRKCGFYFITDYNNQCFYISSVGDDIGTENRGFGHVITSINRQRSAQMQELYGLLKNKRTLRVNYIDPLSSFYMLSDYLESPYNKGLTDYHKAWLHNNMVKFDRLGKWNNRNWNNLRPLKLMMQDVWL